MGMPGRGYLAGNGYRYGFNGKEQDSEVKGNGAQYDYGFRIYDPRVSRFLSVDPLTASYPWYTPYQFAGNKPIIAIDLDGLEEKIVVHHLARYADGEFYVKSTEVKIDHNQVFLSFDSETGKKIVQAKTEVYGEYQGQTHFLGFMYENVTPGGMKPSAAYDYTSQSSMNQKNEDDAEYGGNGWNPSNWGKYTRMFNRDLNAPDNAAVADVQELGAILSTQAAAGATLRSLKATQVSGKTKEQASTGNNTNKTKSDVVPQKAKDVVNYAKEKNGAAQPGYKGGRNFANDGRDGGQVLSKKDANGKPITYKEYDVNPYQKGTNRGEERVVIGSDGKSYYTSNHYKTFTEIKQ